MLPSPYPFTLSKENSYVFKTNSGLTYSVYFDASSGGIFPDEIVDKYTVYLGFSCEPPIEEPFKKKGDSRVGATIMILIANFFAFSPKSILSYICSSANKQERHRAIAFRWWYNHSPLKSEFTHIQMEYLGNYYGVIYSKNHQDISAIEDSLLLFETDNKFEFFEPSSSYMNYSELEEDDFIL